MALQSLGGTTKRSAMTGGSKARNVVEWVGEETVILSKELPALSFAHFTDFQSSR